MVTEALLLFKYTLYSKWLALEGASALTPKGFRRVKWCIRTLLIWDLGHLPLTLAALHTTCNLSLCNLHTIKILSHSLEFKVVWSATRILLHKEVACTLALLSDLSSHSIITKQVEAIPYTLEEAVASQCSNKLATCKLSVKESQSTRTSLTK